jgi:hypothetical protein
VNSINIDKTKPTATATPSPVANAYGWNNTDVTVTFNGTDALSGIASCTAATTLGSEGAGQSASGSCTDKAGNISDPANASGINIDKTPPKIVSGTPPAGTPYLLNQSVTPSFSCTDALSGFASSNSGSASGPSAADCSGPATVNTSTVGSHTYGTMTATDKAGNAATASVDYAVNYSFLGFLAPIDNIPILNSVKAGQTIPIKWQLKDANGNLISDLSSLAANGLVSGPMACSSNDYVLPIEELTSPGSTVFRFDGTQFIFNWQTAKQWAGTCRILQVTLADGTPHYAKMQFK